MGRRLAAIAVVTAGIVAVLVWYVAGYLMVSPPAVSIPAAKGATPTVDLTLQTVAGLGNGYTEPTWVSYLVKDKDGVWQHSTVFTVPAHALVRVTVYQFDGDSGLRNPFLARAQGVVGNVMQVDGKTVDVIDPTLASHTFAVAALHLVVPLIGVPDDAKNQCEQAPCGLDKAHRTITFTRQALETRHAELTGLLGTAANMIGRGVFAQYATVEGCRRCEFRPICGNGILKLYELKRRDARMEAFRAIKEEGK